MTQIIKPPQFCRRNPDSHKGTYGTAFMICGSYGMAGAAVLAARGALKSGVGLCVCALPSAIYPIAAQSVPEAVFVPVGSRHSKRFSAFSGRAIKKRLKTASAVLIGCGLSQSKGNLHVLSQVIKNSRCPLIIDADGINMLSRNINLLSRAKSPVILTPHPKEMSALTNKSISEIQQDREGIARDFAVKHGVYLVLKGNKTVVAHPDGSVYINETGNAGMATGGSGDVLSGIAVSLCAQYKDTGKAINDAVYIHGLSGDFAARKFSQISMLPQDIINELPCVFKSLSAAD